MSIPKKTVGKPARRSSVSERVVEVAPLTAFEAPSYASAKISSKGQITLPVAMRRALGADTVSLRMEGGTITLAPQKDLSGSLKQYARGIPDMKRETEDAWELHIAEKYGRR